MSIDFNLMPGKPCEMRQVDPNDDRQTAILDAAFRAFASYGYRRTKMDDIARGAEISRTALYIHFRNKEDIVRSLELRHFVDAAREMQRVLDASDQTPAQALTAAFIARDGRFMDAVLSTPHGRELLEASAASTSETSLAGYAALNLILSDWLAKHHIRPEMGSPQEMSETINAALKGLKLTATTLAEYRAGQSRLAKLVALALSKTN